MPTKRNVTNGIKKLVAGRQRYLCKANVSGYECPLKGSPFDEAGYDIDHIIPLSEEGSNDISNLQALCVMCHRVKSNRASTGTKKVNQKRDIKKSTKSKKTTGFVYMGPTIYDSDSDSF